MQIIIVYAYDLSDLRYTKDFKDVPGFETPYGGNSDPAFFGIELDNFHIHDNPSLSSLNLKASKEQNEEFKLLFNQLNDEQKDILNQRGDSDEFLISCI